MYKMIRDCCNLWDSFFSLGDVRLITNAPLDIFIKANELLKQRYHLTLDLSQVDDLWEVYSSFNDPPKKTFFFVLRELIYRPTLHLFKCTQTVNQQYSAYSTLYVIASSEEEARLIHPGKGWNRDDFPVWCNSPLEVTVERIDLKEAKEISPILTKEMYLTVLDDLK